MSRPILPRWVTPALAAALLTPCASWAQQTEQELLQHLDSLMPLLDQAKLDADAARGARQREVSARQPTETVDIGLLHVLVPPGQAETARDVIGAVWDRDFAAFVDRSPSLARDRIFFRWAGDEEPYRAPSFRIRFVDGRRWRSRAYMEGEVSRVIGESLEEDLSGTRIQERWGIADVGPPRDSQDLYRSVVVAPSEAVHRCVAGDAEACLVALGLRDDGYAIDDWYTAEERRLMVLRQPGRFGRQAQERRGCLEGSQIACDATLRAYSDSYQETRWASPVSAEVRSSVLWYALRQGGAGAWGRLLEHADDDPAVALQAASGMDALTLATGWRAWLMERRPATHAGSGSLTLGALLWLLLLITLTSRSTRWRLG